MLPVTSHTDFQLVCETVTTKLCGWFLSRVSILTRDIDIANMSVRPSVCPSVHCVPVSEDVSKFVHSSLETRECNPEETVLQPEL